MEVLKQTSPTEAPTAPSPRPHSTVPSARTRTAVAPSGRDAAAALSAAPAGMGSGIGGRPPIYGAPGGLTFNGPHRAASRPSGTRAGTRQDRDWPVGRSRFASRTAIKPWLGTGQVTEWPLCPDRILRCVRITPHACAGEAAKL